MIERNKYTGSRGALTRASTERRRGGAGIARRRIQTRGADWLHEDPRVDRERAGESASREVVSPPLREGQVLLGRLVVVLLVVGRVSQNVARLALADAYRGRQLFLLDRHRLRVLVLPLVHRAASSVHEEVPDRRRFQAQLPRDCHLHLLRRPLGLLRANRQLG